MKGKLQGLPGSFESSVVMQGNPGVFLDGWLTKKKVSFLFHTFSFTSFFVCATKGLDKVFTSFFNIESIQIETEGY